MKRVLIIDDQESVRAVIAEVLEDWSDPLEVEQAENGQIAWDKIQANPYDLLICDVKMPVMDGFEVLKRVRENEATKDLAVIMLTAEDQVEAIWKGASLGATSYVTKPFNLDELLDALKIHI